MSYSKERKEAVLKKLQSDPTQSISDLASQENMSEGTLYNWRKELKQSGQLFGIGSNTSSHWTSDDKFAAVLETASKNQAELSAWCRERGVYPEQLEQWRIACQKANSDADKRQAAGTKMDKESKTKISSLEKELHRKDQALAETAALLTLKKKANAIWGEGEDE